MSLCVVVSCVLAMVGEPDAKERSEASQPPVAYPHPLITEILYNVPKAADGDADLDGRRSATGDEFIELMNPHSKAINLKGYVISDALPLKGPDSESGNRKADKAVKGKKDDDAPAKASKPKRSQVRFVFPALELKPGEVVVVFNGFESSPKGAVGDATAAAGKNENFGGAYVLNMRVKTNFAALSNTGDCVTLEAPDGKNVQCVRWGDVGEEKKLESALVVEEAPTSTGSVQRDAVDGKSVPHADLPGGASFSPGVFGVKAKEPVKESGKK